MSLARSLVVATGPRLRHFGSLRIRVILSSEAPGLVIEAVVLARVRLLLSTISWLLATDRSPPLVGILPIIMA